MTEQTNNEIIIILPGNPLNKLWKRATLIKIVTFGSNNSTCFDDLYDKRRYFEYFKEISRN